MTVNTIQENNFLISHLLPYDNYNNNKYFNYGLTFTPHCSYNIINIQDITSNLNVSFRLMDKLNCKLQRNVSE